VLWLSLLVSWFDAFRDLEFGIWMMDGRAIPLCFGYDRTRPISYHVTLLIGGEYNAIYTPLTMCKWCCNPRRESTASRSATGMFHC
jgi:hypothetical protein